MPCVHLNAERVCISFDEHDQIDEPPIECAWTVSGKNVKPPPGDWINFRFHKSKWVRIMSEQDNLCDCGRSFPVAMCPNTSPLCRWERRNNKMVRLGPRIQRMPRQAAYIIWVLDDPQDASLTYVKTEMAFGTFNFDEPFNLDPETEKFF